MAVTTIAILFLVSGSITDKKTVPGSQAMGLLAQRNASVTSLHESVTTAPTADARPAAIGMRDVDATPVRTGDDAPVKTVDDAPVKDGNLRDKSTAHLPGGGKANVHGDFHKAISDALAGPSSPDVKMVGYGVLACILSTLSYLYQPKTERATKYRAGVGFMVCSGTLVMCNKLAVSTMQMATTIVAVQLWSTVLTVKVASAAGLIEVESLQWPLIKAFLPVAATFLVVVIMGAKILQNAPVETMIIVRASPLLVVCALEIAFLGKATPPPQSILCLLCVVGGTIAYAYIEATSFTVTLSVWILLWYAAFCFDQVYIKHVINTVKLSVWSNVYYTNFLAGLICLPFVAMEVMGQIREPHGNFSAGAFVLVGSTCILGTCMSYFAFAARAAFSATYFTLLGNICKLVTILSNNYVWSHHAASFNGTVCVLLALLSAYGFEEHSSKAKLELLLTEEVTKDTLRSSKATGNEDLLRALEERSSKSKQAKTGIGEA